MNVQRHVWARALSRSRLPDIGGHPYRSGSRVGRLSSSSGDYEQVDMWQEGDDIRHVDWSATARTGELHVRRARGSHPRDVVIAVDDSAGMRLGTAVSKLSTATLCAAALAFVARRDGHRVSWLDLHSGDLSSSWLPREDPADRPRSISAPPRSLLILVSDFRPAPPWEEALDSLQPSVAVVAVEVRDSCEMVPPHLGKVLLRDPASGATTPVDLSNSSWREDFSKRSREDRDTLARRLASRGAWHVVVPNESGALVSLAHSLEVS